MNTLVLLRGLPGSGKSTAARLFHKAPHFEADMYFIAPDGSYQFDVTRLKDAHNWCKKQTMKAMESGYPTIVVTNTFTQEWEMSDYIAIAQVLGYQIVTMIVENRHNGENIHGVPVDKLEIMRNRFEIKL